MRKHFFLCSVPNMNEKHELILGCLRWAEALATQERKRTGVALDELRSAAYEGLCRAAENYDPAKGAFTTWSGVHVRERFSDLHRRGRLTTGFRQWFEVDDSEIPEQDRELAAALRAGKSLREVSKELGLTVSAIDCRRTKILRVRDTNTRVSLDPWLDNEGHPAQVSPVEEENRHVRQQQIDTVLRELRALPDTLRDVIVDVLFREVTFKAVGVTQGVTKQCAHQRYGEAIKELQKRCKKYC